MVKGTWYCKVHKWNNTPRMDDDWRSGWHCPCYQAPTASAASPWPAPVMTEERTGPKQRRGRSKSASNKKPTAQEPKVYPSTEQPSKDSKYAEISAVNQPIIDQLKKNLENIQ